MNFIIKQDSWKKFDFNNKTAATPVKIIYIVLQKDLCLCVWFVCLIIW